MAKYAIGDRVKLTRKKSLDHFRIADMPVTGRIDKTRTDGPYERRFQILFDDGRAGWYADWEFSRIN